jgi:hypothetical protein
MDVTDELRLATLLTSRGSGQPLFAVFAPLVSEGRTSVLTGTIRKVIARSLFNAPGILLHHRGDVKARLAGQSFRRRIIKANGLLAGSHHKPQLVTGRWSWSRFWYRGDMLPAVLLVQWEVWL